MSDPQASEDLKPIGLTVYDLPQQTSSSLSESSRTRGGRMYMMLVLLACAAPVLLSYLTYYVIRPEGRVHHGELIEPQRPLPAVAMVSLSGEPAALTSLKGQWLLVSVAGAACDASCQQHLYLQRQILVGLGKERPRTEWVWLVNDKAEIPNTLLPALEEATVLRIDPKALAQWLQPEANKKLEDHLYMVDPMGEWMMRFPAQLNTEGALKAKRDMERLLRASASWDLPGR